MVRRDPKEARRRILVAFVRSNANITATASLLGCKRSTLKEWAKALGLLHVFREAIKIAKRDGWYHGRVGGGGWGKASSTVDLF